MSRTICIDLDGTLAKYTRGDFRDGVIGEPLPGARDAMLGFRERGFRIVIHSARWSEDLVDSEAKREAIMADVRTWLLGNDIPFDDLWHGRGKPVAWAYVDDAAIRFSGNWPDVVMQIDGMTREPI